MSDSYQAALARSAAIEKRLEENPASLRMLTGDRPTGALHIGHYFGSIKNRVKLQQQWRRDLAADRRLPGHHRPGDARRHPGQRAQPDLDNIAAGLDPERATIFTHSAVPALTS